MSAGKVDSWNSSLAQPKDRPHVMFIIGSLKRGGAQTQLVYVASALAQRGWVVTVLQFHSYTEDAFRRQLESASIKLISLNGRRKRWILPTILYRALKVVWRQQPDVLIGFLYHGIMAVRLIGGAVRVPAVVSSIRNECLGRREEILIRLTDRLSHATTTMSSHLATRMRERDVVAASRLHVIPNMVPIAPEALTQRCRCLTRRELDVAPEQFLWLAVGGLRAQKDYPNLLQAFAALASKFPTARLIIAGTGELRNEIDELIQKLGLKGTVQLLGLRSDVPTLYEACDAFVLSSAWEGMPNVVLEAMASKTPVVATAVGSVKEMVSDGYSGLVVPPHDHMALADAMARMMSTDKLAKQQFVDVGFERAFSDFASGDVTEKWENLMTDLLNDSRSKFNET